MKISDLRAQAQGCLQGAIETYTRRILDYEYNGLNRDDIDYYTKQIKDLTILREMIFRNLQ